MLISTPGGVKGELNMLGVHVLSVRISSVLVYV